MFRRLMGDYLDNETNAVDDLGTDMPDRARAEVWTYARNPRVRERVLQRANGRCEFCGKPGFVKPDGGRYLESHHVIALANDGADRPTNVIALCPNDHREAHFGERAEDIEREMVQKLKDINR
jgi:5-methylcytosine-specific restriction endonuclease McrA